jgi:hypothetical protein
MDAAITYTLEEAHQPFAKMLNGEVWKLLERADRSKLDDDLMIHAAHASCYHWLRAGTGLEHQRSEWLISHVYAELGIANAALRHATRCLELTTEFADLMKDFDRAYAYEGAARANALAENRDAAIQYIQLAQDSGQAIGDDEDRRIFLSDFNGGDWHGLR